VNPTQHRPRASASLNAVPLWRIRLARELPRLLLYAAAAAGLIASARFALAPPRPTAPFPTAASAKPADLQAEGYATLFARAYLSWQQSEPEARRRALEGFSGPGLSLEVGTQAPSQGSEQVIFEQVVQEREPRPNLHIYTIAAQTQPEGLLYITVPVLHAPGGALSLAGYPAFVGAPRSAPAAPDAQAGAEVQEAALRTVLTRALRNYLAPAPSDLAADLAPGASVSPPSQGLRLEAVQSLTWAEEDSHAVLTQVAVAGPGGARYTLAYEVEVQEQDGRWEIAAIQMEARR
jgi:Conjugative transposon protein TcpC